jgi:membrane protein
MKLRTIWDVIKKAGAGWMDDNAMRLGASLAFYTLLSSAPLVVIVLAIAGVAFRKNAVQGQLVAQLRDLMGPEGGAAVQTMIDSASKPGSGSGIAMVLGILTLLFAASGVFAELQDALNAVWGVKPRPGRALWVIIRERFLSFVMILCIGFLLLVSLVVTAVLSALTGFTGLDSIGIIGEAISFLASFLVITLLFALIFKFLPDVKLGWRDVWVGAAVTSLLFTVGKLLIGLYLGRASIGSAYGAAGSLVVFLVWIYYSSLILFYGAEFTKFYACETGRHIEPTDNAMFVGDRGCPPGPTNPTRAAS